MRDGIETVLNILGGLALFLFAVNSLSDTIKDLAGERTKRLVQKYTRNVFSGIITGLVVTALLDSSSATIIITIVMVNGGILTFRQAMGIVLGSNIGTTISSQIIAMDIGKFSPVILVIGLLLMMISKSEKISKTGRAILYFGVLFFGLFTMERGIEPLKEHPAFFEIMSRMDNPLAGTLAGAAVTVLIQSSSATVGMAIVLAKKGALSLAGGIAVMMGAELGTVSDTLLATKGYQAGVKNRNLPPDFQPSFHHSRSCFVRALS